MFKLLQTIFTCVSQVINVDVIVFKTSQELGTEINDIHI